MPQDKINSVSDVQKLPDTLEFNQAKFDEVFGKTSLDYNEDLVDQRIKELEDLQKNRNNSKQPASFLMYPTS
jgi:hypothetical protein